MTGYEEVRMQAAWVALKEQLIGIRSGDVEVTDVRIARTSYPLDGEIVRNTSVTLVLTDPPHPDTWPGENIGEIKRLANAAARTLEIEPFPVLQVRTRPGYADEVYGPEEAAR